MSKNKQVRKSRDIDLVWELLAPGYGLLVLGGDEINVQLSDQKKGTYLAEYTIDRLHGILTLSVCLRGVHISGNPFVINVKALRN